MIRELDCTGRMAADPNDRACRCKGCLANLAIRDAVAAENARCVQVLDDLGYHQLAMRIYEPAQQAAPRPGLPGRDDLYRLAARNAVVKHFVTLCGTGDLTFEQCLVALACELAKQNELYAAAELKRLQLAPFNPVIIDGGKAADSYKLNPGGQRS